MNDRFKDLREALNQFPSGWDGAFSHVRESERGVAEIGHPWDEGDLSTVITVSTVDFLNCDDDALTIARYIAAANPGTIAALLAEIDALNAASKEPT